MSEQDLREMIIHELYIKYRNYNQFIIDIKLTILALKLWLKLESLQPILSSFCLQRDCWQPHQQQPDEPPLAGYV